MKIRFNLLPDTQKNHLKTQKTLRTVMEQEIYILIVIGIFVLSLYGVFFVLKTESTLMHNVEEQLSTQGEYAHVVDMHTLFQQTDARVVRIERMQSHQVKWSQFFDIISNVFTQHISVEHIKTNGTQLNIYAQANTREDVVDLKNRLNAYVVDDVHCFEDVVVPESDLVAPEDVLFTVSFTINKECLY